MQMWTILKTTTMIGSTPIILSMTTTVWNIHMEYEREKGEIMDFRDEFLLNLHNQSQSQTIPYCYNPQSPMMKHPSRKNDELQKSRDQVRCLCRKFKEQEKDEPQDKLSFDELVRNDEHLIQDVPWELGGIPNIQDNDMGEAKAKLSIAKALSLPKTILKYKRKPQMIDEVGDP